MERLFGRDVIYSDVDEITKDNIITVLNSTRDLYMKNQAQADYLYWYRRGKQPILNREKEVRPEICNRITVNRADEIASFKTGYLCGEPIQYISRRADDTVSQNINRLNDMMLVESKAAKDKELLDWCHEVGTGYRMVLPSTDKESESPFEIYTLDPRYTYVIYSSKIGNKPLAGIVCGKNSEGETIHTVYTPKLFMEVKNGKKVITEKKHSLGRIPIIEYPANKMRLGSYETVLPLLDAINTVASNRVDGVEQFIQSLVKFINCEIDKDSFAALQQLGAIQIKSTDGQNADVEIMTQELNQTQTQTLMEDMYQTVLTICGMPNRNGKGSSTSDTGAASLLRDGWTLAEARAKDSEQMFKPSEREFLKIVLHICKTNADMDIRLSDIEPKFTRRNYENIQTKSQVLCQMLDNDKIDPKYAYASCGMFTDPEEAYQAGMKWFAQREAKAEADAKRQSDSNIASEGDKTQGADKPTKNGK